MSYADDGAHPVALRPGKGKSLVECDTVGATGIAPNDMIALFAIDTSGETFRPVAYADPATVHPAAMLDELRENLAAEKLLSESRIKLCNELHDQRDVARRDLAEALEWMLEDARIRCWNQLPDPGCEVPHLAQGRAILARHEQPNFTFNAYDDDGNLISPSQHDRRKQPEAVDWKARAESLKSALIEAKAQRDKAQSRRHFLEGECERLKDNLHEMASETDNALFAEKAALGRAEQAEAKLATIKTAIEDGQSTGYILYLICGPEAAPAPPAQELADIGVHAWVQGELLGLTEGFNLRLAAMQREIDAMRAAMKERA